MLEVLNPRRGAPYQACRPWVCRVCLFQPGGTDYAHLITGTPGFSDLPTALHMPGVSLGPM